MTLPTSQIQETFRDLVDQPDKRFQKFFQYYCTDTINVNPSFSLTNYHRSGKEMIRMANIYFGEKDYFHAFVLYSRFLVLNLDKIKSHPQYANCDKTITSDINKQLKTIAFPRAEKLKQYIKDLFEHEAKEYRKRVEEEKLNALAKSQPKENHKNDDLLNGQDLNELKLKYNLENEAQLRQLQEKELNSLINSMKVTDDNIEHEEASNNQKDSNTAKDKPVVNRALKPKSSNEQNSYNLRTIVIPYDLTRKFLDVAEANTKRNVETCGILAGKLSNNKFLLSHCIIPKQKGTSDTCQTEQEHELFDVIDQSNLITLGWIHTHPSQTAFLSSIDLHTHFGYQIMIPEAIAIVCAPSYDEIGTFILTPTYGMKEIADCSKTGFHPHTNNPPLFEECDHVRIDNKLSIELIDLRMITIR